MWVPLPLVVHFVKTTQKTTRWTNVNGLIIGRLYPILELNGHNESTMISVCRKNRSYTFNIVKNT